MMATHWDESFPVIRLNGAGARDFLQGQTTADLRQTQPGVLQQSCWLTATGRLRAVLELRLDGDGADVMVLAGDADAMAQGLDQVIFPADRVRIGERRLQRRVQALDADSPSAWISSEGTLPAELVSSLPLPASAFEQKRVRLGFPPGPAELTGNTNPFELGLAKFISLDKGCYLGQEMMAKLAARGGIKQQLRCWLSSQPLRSGELLLDGETRAGVVTSSLALRNDSFAGLALIRRQYLSSEQLSGPGGEVLTMERPELFQDPPSPD